MDPIERPSSRLDDAERVGDDELDAVRCGAEEAALGVPRLAGYRVARGAAASPVPRDA